MIITDDLKWNENTAALVKRVNSKMELPRRVASFGTTIEEMKNIYILFIRSVLEQSCVVLNSYLTEENIQDLERIQKSAVRIILGNNYKDYESALLKVDLETLGNRRKDLCLKFARSCLKNKKQVTCFN